MSTETLSTVNIAIQRRKPLLPRQADVYDNELHGWDDPLALDGTPWADEDRLDSCTIIDRNAKVAIPSATDTWHDSHAALELAALPKSGVWVPWWISKITRHPARALFLSWLLHLFDACVPKNDKDAPLCRARAIDQDGHRWWQTTRRQIVAETLLAEKAADRARSWLEQHDLIFCDSNQRGLFLRPVAKSLMEGYYSLTGDVEVEDELKNLTDEVGWFGCHTQRRAKLSANGVFVHDALLIICDHKPGPALVLADTLYWHSLNKTGQSRARITRQREAMDRPVTARLQQSHRRRSCCTGGIRAVAG